MSGRTLRVGLVGAGAIAQVAELPALAALPGVVIAGLVTATKASRARNLARWPIERGYDSFEEMIADARLDAVFVLTPMDQHGSFVETALRADLDVFCEKPLCASLADARRLADLADECDRMLMVGFNRRYAPVFVKARAAFGPAGPQFCLAQKSRPDHEYRTTLESAIHLVLQRRLWPYRMLPEPALGVAGPGRGLAPLLVLVPGDHGGGVPALLWQHDLKQPADFRHRRVVPIFPPTRPASAAVGPRRHSDGPS